MKDRNVLIVTLAGLASLLIESAALARAAAGAWTFATAAWVHVGIAAALSLWTLLSPACRKDLRMPLLLTIMTCFLGPIGTLGAMVTMALVKHYEKSATPFEEWYASLFPERHIENEAAAWQASILKRDDAGKGSVAPFSDILFFGTLAQKQDLITLVAKNFQPAFAPVLRMALTDSNNSIRVHAASAITMIEDEFLERSLRLSAEVLRHPGDPAMLLKLAELNDEYASAGILDHEREQESRENAREAYREYLRLRPKDLEASIAIGRLFLMDGRYKETSEWLEQWGPPDESSPRMFLLYVEALYNLGRFAELRRLAAARYSSLAASSEMTLEARETLRLWAGAT